MVRVQIEVADERVDKWDEYVDADPGLTTRSELIRKSVERTISDENSVTDELNDTLDEVIGQNEEAIQRINELDNAVQTLRSENVEADEMESIVSTVASQIQHKLDTLNDKVPVDLELLISDDDGDDDDGERDYTSVDDDTLRDLER